MTRRASQLPDFSMSFEPMTIEHLGLRLYSSLPPVLSELVSNAYDANAPRVSITVPEGPVLADDEIVVRDWGHGMSPGDLQDDYLPIGRNRRGLDGTNDRSRGGEREVTGRKGLGKLSGFGVAEEIEICSYHDRRAVCLRLNFGAIQEWARTHAHGEPFRPTVVAARTGRTTERNGVEIRLRGLRRARARDPGVVRRELAKRLTLIGPGFEVRVNDTPIGPGDRVQRSECDSKLVWDVAALPGGGRVGAGETLAGWIGFLPSTSQIGRGVDIYAKQKAAELGSFFNLRTTDVQFARAYLVGEVHADFLDRAMDAISTARNSVVWDSEPGQALQTWGQDTIKWAFLRWTEERRRRKEVEVIKTAGFDRWLAERQPFERKIAERMVRLLVDDENMEPESVEPLLEIVKGSVESRYFLELVGAIEEDQGTSVSRLLELFAEWRIIEARTALKTADGRQEAMGKLEHYIRAGALEVKQMHPLLLQHPWLLDTGWGSVETESTYTEQLRKHCREPKATSDKDRRMDILGIGHGGVLTVVEIKRPEKTLSREDLEQIERYVDWADNNLVGTGPHSPTLVRGLLVVGKLNADHKKKMTRLAGDDIRVETYRDLLARAREQYRVSEKHLRNLAPEYRRQRKPKGESKPAVAPVVSTRAVLKPRRPRASLGDDSGKGAGDGGAK